MQNTEQLILTGQEGVGKFRKKIQPGLLAKEKATDKQWLMAGIAIEAFGKAYPVEWANFVKYMHDTRAESSVYAEAREGDLKKAEFRHTCSFPAVLDENGNAIDGLYPVLQNIIPGLTHKDSVNFREFLRRFPVFSPSDKLNV